MSTTTMSAKGDSITECELTHVIGETSPGIDTAWKFLDKHRDTHVEVDITALRRKIDWRIVPLMFCCYTMQFLDKVILNVCYTPITLHSQAKSHMALVRSGYGNDQGPKSPRQ